MDSSNTNDLAALERFVVENDDLLELEATVGRFNIFDALRMERAEIRHSNFLAWLLNPSESHGQGDLFLKAVLMDMLRLSPPSRRPLSPAALDGLDLHDVEIRREYRYIDLLVISSDPALVLAIENKIDSGEHSDQLGRYKRLLSTEFQNVPALHVFLTPSGYAASDEDWVLYSYTDLHRVLARVRRMAGGSLGGDVGVFLAHYLDLIESRLMNDPHIDDLCKRIYANHRRAIDLIVDRAAAPGAGLANDIRTWLDELRPRWLTRSIGNRNVIQAVLESWVGSLSTPDALRAPHAPTDLFVEIEVGADRRNFLAARLVVGPGEPQERRREVISRLTAPPFNLPTQRKKLSDVWTRLGSQTLATWDEYDEPPTEELKRTIGSYLGKLSELLQPLPGALCDLSRPGK